MTLVLTTPPATAIVSLAEAKEHLRVSIADDDAVITALVEAATERWEQYTRRATRSQGFTLYLDEFPSSYADGGAIELLRPPLLSVATVKYFDSAGVLTALVEDTDYTVYEHAGLLAQVRPAYGKSWPSTRARPSAVEVVYTAGYTAAALPTRFKQAVLLTVGHWYENREETLVGVPAQVLPQAGKDLLYSLRVLEIG